MSSSRKLTPEEISRYLRTMSSFPPELAPLAPYWIGEILPLLMSLSKKLDEVMARLDKIEKLLKGGA